MKKLKNGFTLIELIVVIAIISILAVVSVVTVKKWITNSEKSKRLADVNLIWKSLKMHKLKKGEYPKPWKAVKLLDSNDKVIWYQWLYDESVLDQWVDVNQIPTDPQNKKYYTFTTILNPQLWYEVWTIQDNVPIIQWEMPGGYYKPDWQPKFPRPLSLVNKETNEFISEDNMWTGAIIALDTDSLATGNIEWEWDYIVAPILSGSNDEGPVWTWGLWWAIPEDMWWWEEWWWWGWWSWDTTPDSYAFTDVTEAELSTVYTWQMTVAWMWAWASTWVSITAWTLFKNDVNIWTSGTGQNWDVFKIELTSSASNTTAVDSIMTIWGVSDTYTITTKAGAILALDFNNEPAGPITCTSCTSY